MDTSTNTDPAQVAEEFFLSAKSLAISHLQLIELWNSRMSALKHISEAISEAEAGLKAGGAEHIPATLESLSLLKEMVAVISGAPLECNVSIDQIEDAAAVLGRTIESIREAESPNLGAA